MWPHLSTCYLLAYWMQNLNSWLQFIFQIVIILKPYSESHVIQIKLIKLRYRDFDAQQCTEAVILTGRRAGWHGELTWSWFQPMVFWHMSPPNFYSIHWLSFNNRNQSPKTNKENEKTKIYNTWSLSSVHGNKIQHLPAIQCVFFLTSWKNFVVLWCVQLHNNNKPTITLVNSQRL